MPTFNQLVRKGRQSVAKKSTAPALQKGFNSLKKRPTDASSPQKRGAHRKQWIISAPAVRQANQVNNRNYNDEIKECGDRYIAKGDSDFS